MTPIQRERARAAVLLLGGLAVLARGPAYGEDPVPSTVVAGPYVVARGELHLVGADGYDWVLGLRVVWPDLGTAPTWIDGELRRCRLATGQCASPYRFGRGLSRDEVTVAPDQSWLAVRTPLLGVELSASWTGNGPGPARLVSGSPRPDNNQTEVAIARTGWTADFHAALGPIGCASPRGWIESRAGLLFSGRPGDPDVTTLPAGLYHRGRGPRCGPVQPPPYPNPGPAPSPSATPTPGPSRSPSAAPTPTAGPSGSPSAMPTPGPVRSPWVSASPSPLPAAS